MQSSTGASMTYSALQKRYAEQWRAARFGAPSPSKPGVSASSITGLLLAGKRLTASEMNYLSKNDIALYVKALNVAEDRYNYGRQLKQCRTRDDARRLHMHRLGVLSGQARAEQAIGGDGGEARMGLSAAAKEYNDYTATREYAKLPENELALAARIRAKKRHGRG